jgi:hypothetical protein
MENSARYQYQYMLFIIVQWIQLPLNCKQNNRQKYSKEIKAVSDDYQIGYYLRNTFDF